MVCQLTGRVNLWCVNSRDVSTYGVSTYGVCQLLMCQLTGRANLWQEDGTGEDVVINAGMYNDSHQVASLYRGTSLIRKRTFLGAYSRTMPRALWNS